MIRFEIKSLIILVVLALLASPESFAERIKFDEDELAIESVLPVFDRPLSVMNRNVQLKGRGELGLFGGMVLDEPFYNPYILGAQGTYHFNEEIGLNVTYYSWLGGKSDYMDGLATPSIGFKIDNLPEPEFSLLGNLQYTMYYGKMSLTKSTAINLSLYALAGGGAISFAGEMMPTVTGGIGQKFYISKNLALRFDMRLLAFQGPNILSENPRTINSPASPSDFSDKFFLYTVLTSGLSYIF